MKYTDWIIPRLRALDDERAALSAIPMQIKTLALKATSIRSALADGTPVIGSGNGREEALIAVIAERDELSERLEWTRREVETVEAALARLTEEEQHILDVAFVIRQRGGIDRLCEELGYERTQVYRKRNEALIRLARILYGTVTL